MNKEFTKILVVLIGIITGLLVITDCDTKIFGKPVWPCPYNENRLKHLYIQDISGKYTSQSLFDIYTFTHISHGIVLFYVLYYLYGKKTNSIIYIALGLEILWEIIENTPFIIEKYRKENKNSRDYSGDSIINSIGDILAMIIGFIVCWCYPKYGWILFIVNEILLYLYMKDNLIMNIIGIFR